MARKFEVTLETYEADRLVEDAGHCGLTTDQMLRVYVKTEIHRADEMDREVQRAVHERLGGG